MERVQSDVDVAVDRHAWAGTVLVAAPAVLAVQTLGRFWLVDGGEAARAHALTLVAVLSLALVASLLRGVRGARPLGAIPALVALAPLAILAPEAIPVERFALLPVGAVAGVAAALVVRAVESPRADARLRLAEATGWLAACAVAASWLLAAS